MTTTRRSLFAVLAIAAIALLGVTALARFGFGVPTEVRGAGTAQTLSQAEEDRLQAQRWHILRYCSEDRSARAERRYARAVEALIAFARRRPNALYRSGAPFSHAHFAPAIKRFLIAEATFIRRTCGAFGNARQWAGELRELESAGRQLLAEDG